MLTMCPVGPRNGLAFPLWNLVIFWPLAPLVISHNPRQKFVLCATLGSSIQFTFMLWPNWETKTCSLVLLHQAVLLPPNSLQNLQLEEGEEETRGKQAQPQWLATFDWWLPDKDQERTRHKTESIPYSIWGIVVSKKSFLISLVTYTI